jgi:enamine deaminase RidA (YjgF/YER057c/UK114 family)
VARRVVPALSPFADQVGYSRAVRVGPHVYVAGTAPVMPDGADPPADPYGQAKRCLEIALAAMAEVGAGPEDVVRSRILVTRAEDFPGIGRAHGEIFRDIRPVNTSWVVGGLLDPRWLVEIELEAYVDEEAR